MAACTQPHYSSSSTKQEIAPQIRMKISFLYKFNFISIKYILFFRSINMTSHHATYAPCETQNYPSYIIHLEMKAGGLDVMIILFSF